MSRPELEQALVAAFEELDVIDCHEHLGPEERRTGTDADVFTLFTSYTPRDLWLAGMSHQQLQSLQDRSIPLDERWATFKPAWERIRYGSYARPVLLAIERFYGFDDINDDTYVPLSDAVRAANTPGIYERVLRDACRIRTCLTLCGTTDTGTPLLTPLVRMPYEFHPDQAYAYPALRTWADVEKMGADIASPDDFVAAFRRFLARSQTEGAVGVKMAVARHGEPDRQEAESAFAALRDGTVDELPAHNPLRDYVFDRLIAAAGELGMVVAVHTGYWGDFRELHPLHMVPILRRHRDVRFDIYHLGYPWARETLMLAKEFANVWVNLCWANVISPRCAEQALSEALDLLPVNKVLAFGGDYGVAVEKVYGQLVMARENAARALAGHIQDGRLTETQAVEVAQAWFHDNAVALYDLDTEQV